MNKRNELFIQIFRAILGLFIFSFGLHLTIRADIGLAPWECLATGISMRTGLSFGISMTICSLVILAVDLLLKERIGYGTLLDAFLVGQFMDFWAYTGLIPKGSGLFISIAMIIVGLFIMAYGQYFYMSAALSCGPRDSLLVALGKRAPNTPIGIVQTAMLAGALLFGWLLGGPVGIGTIITTVFIGTTLQIICNLLHFEPRNVRHRNIPEATRILAQK